MFSYKLQSTSSYNQLTKLIVRHISFISVAYVNFQELEGLPEPKWWYTLSWKLFKTTM